MFSVVMNIRHGADGGTRTRTSVAYYPLKIACLPIPPHLHYAQRTTKAYINARQIIAVRERVVKKINTIARANA